MAVRLLEFWGGLPAELEAELGLFELGRSGGRTRVLALDRVARSLAGRVRVVEDREARPEDIAAHYAGLRGPDARARSRFRLKLLLGMAEEEEGVLPDDFWVEALGGLSDMARMGAEMARLGLDIA